MSPITAGPAWLITEIGPAIAQGQDETARVQKGRHSQARFGLPGEPKPPARHPFLILFTPPPSITGGDRNIKVME